MTGVFSEAENDSPAGPDLRVGCKRRRGGGPGPENDVTDVDAAESSLQATPNAGRPAGLAGDLAGSKYGELGRPIPWQRLQDSRRIRCGGRGGDPLPAVGSGEETGEFQEPPDRGSRREMLSGRRAAHDVPSVSRSDPADARGRRDRVAVRSYVAMDTHGRPAALRGIRVVDGRPARTLGG